MTPQFAPIQRVREDLELVGLRLESRIEGCTCESCKSLDGNHDVDLVVADADGAAHLVSYRDQRDHYDYQTLTIRETNDKGNSNVQAAKIRAGRSLAGLYVQGYTNGVVWTRSVDLKAAMRRAAVCPKHPRLQLGVGGQTFLIFCQWCTAMQYVPRAERASKGGWYDEASLRDWGPLTP